MLTVSERLSVHETLLAKLEELLDIQLRVLYYQERELKADNSEVKDANHRFAEIKKEHLEKAWAEIMDFIKEETGGETTV